VSEILWRRNDDDGNVCVKKGHIKERNWVVKK
jgi:hypothetical protein